MHSPDMPNHLALCASELAALKNAEPMLWLNPNHGGPTVPMSGELLEPNSAITRFARCAGLMAKVFPQLASSNGQIQSPLVAVPGLQQHFQQTQGTWLLKRDDALPIAGSIKARGGFHEILALAERLAISKGIISESSDRLALASASARHLFEQYKITVGSTGNLGLSIGLIAKGLGFQVAVHMSADAKEWKKTRLRAANVEVVEHVGDYASAVQAGRLLAQSDPYSHFVDDENSSDLFLGYAGAAQEIQIQLTQQGRKVNASHPLFVYLPCGVGGAPGGIAYGLKRIFGAHVHCFFAEPVASPCMLVWLANTDGAPVSVYDVGLSNRTEADGLAVAQASPLVAPLMRGLLSGIFTVSDETLFRDIYALKHNDDVQIEPSAAAGFRGPLWLAGSEQGSRYLESNGLLSMMANSTHILWSTGGSLVPAQEHERFQKKGKALSAV